VTFNIGPGTPLPLGASINPSGVNFSLLSQNATKVELLLFDRPDAPLPSQVVTIASPTQFYWHAQVDGLTAGAAYAYRIHGPGTGEETRLYGHRFNANKVLIDPYAPANVKTLWRLDTAIDASDNVATSMRSVVVDLSDYDWENDSPPKISPAETIVYELHVRGFTQSSSSGVARPGTFAGLIEKLPYIKGLGVTSVELMPVFEFDGASVRRLSPTSGKPLTNYWGYDPNSFFALQDEYCVSSDPAAEVREFRDFVKAAHRMGLEVILDVVFNHTGEGDQNGPVISWKGIDNSIFYFLDPSNRSHYLGNLTGCPNGVRCNHPVCARMVADSLVHWVTQMHVDGFRFDLGAVLTLGEDARPLQDPAVVWQMNLDPRLAKIKVIVEPFGGNVGDALGSFPDIYASTWNYRFKNTVRRFVRGERGLVAEMATRTCGSSDIFQWAGFGPLNGVSYVTCHDGFTLNDLVTFAASHNEANGEVSGDGDNLSSNYGTEGPSANPSLEGLRERQIKNFLSILMLSQGIPMILAGDECRRTQKGNNNAYLQDNEDSWFDWTLTSRHADLVAFVQFLTDFRRRHPALHRGDFFRGVPSQRGLLDVEFHGCRLNSPGFSDPNSGVLAVTVADPGDGEDVHFILNMEDTVLPFELPAVRGRAWHRAADTALAPPDTFAAPGTEVKITTPQYVLSGRSVVVLVSKDEAHG
jgi:glycogen operon protein